MSRKHQIGGSHAKGFAALAEKRRCELASMGGKACHARHGHWHMAMIGMKGAKALHGAKGERGA